MLEPIRRPRMLGYTRPEPRLSPVEQHGPARTLRRRSAAGAPQGRWLLEAASFGIGLLWALITVAALFLWALTGRREWFDACRSDAVLAATAGLMLLSLLAASWRRA